MSPVTDVPRPRQATLEDIAELVALENQSFKTDRISQRSFRYFLTKSQAEIWVLGQPITAYGLVLFHRGTSLARIYSLAVAESERGKGLAKALMEGMERSAIQHNALFIRLEVGETNTGALKLYEALGYEPVKRLFHYYEDGKDGIRMEKKLRIAVSKPANLPYYAQTTDFTCGAAALLMATKQLNKKQPLSRIEELNIWRDATTIFMTTGHGGTSPYGLALAAKARGYVARLWVSHRSAPFLDGVRNEEKKQVVDEIHRDFYKRCKKENIQIENFPKDITELKTALNKSEKIILLISTYRLNRKKEPHWIWVVEMDNDYVYFNDPDVDEEEWKTPVDLIYVPVPIAEFSAMMKYGKNQYRAAVIISQ